MPLTKEQMREYMRNRRKSVNPDCKPADVNPDCKPQNVNLPANYGQPDCECKHCQQSRSNKSKLVINHGDYKKANELAANEVNRVSMPGDSDYD